MQKSYNFNKKYLNEQLHFIIKEGEVGPFNNSFKRVPEKILDDNRLGPRTMAIIVCIITVLPAPRYRQIISNTAIHQGTTAGKKGREENLKKGNQ